MSSHRARIALLGSLIFALTSCTPSISASDDDALPAPSSNPEWLFVVQSTGDSQFDAQSNTLSMPTNAVQGFTDRPFRESREFAMSDFVGLWTSSAADSFSVDPPNAALTYWVTEGTVSTPTTLVCEIVGGVNFSPDTGLLSLTLRALTPGALSLPDRLERASLFIDDVTTCDPSPDDNTIVESFNEMNFTNEFTIVTTRDSTTNDYVITLTCPSRTSPPVAPSSMDVRISTPDRALSASCYEGQSIRIAHDKATTAPYCEANGDCTFVVTAHNSVTGTTYSETELSIRVTSAATMIPELNPATLPVCIGGFDNLINGG